MFDIADQVSGKVEESGITAAICLDRFNNGSVLQRICSRAKPCDRGGTYRLNFRVLLRFFCQTDKSLISSGARAGIDRPYVITGVVRPEPKEVILLGKSGHRNRFNSLRHSSP